jgi:hypothetical protein
LNKQQNQNERLQHDCKRRNPHEKEHHSGHSSPSS